MENRPYKCKECGVEFEAFDRMWEHMEVCERGFSIPFTNSSVFIEEGVFPVITFSGFTGLVYLGKDGKLYRCTDGSEVIELVEGGSKSE